MDFAIPIDKIMTPSYIVDENLLIKNLEVLKYVQHKANCKILLAQKGFSMFHFYPLIKKYLAGTISSGIFEAKLAYEEMGKEVHVYSPAFSKEEFNNVAQISDFIVFNSFNQFTTFKNKVNRLKTNVMIRVNPEYAEVETELYNPAGKYSRLGVTKQNFEKDFLNHLDEIDGLHFHTMCEQNSDVLERTLNVFEQSFGEYLHNMKYINFGGGHHITRDNYDIEKLIYLIKTFKEKYNVEVYLEPGEAIALNTGYLVSSVLDIIYNDMDIAILDTSAACHMPDVLEMPYRPNIINAQLPNKNKYTYRLTCPTCLAGDIIGDYSFNEKLKIDDKIIFCDMAHYTMVKNNTFNGMPLPSIYEYSSKKEIKLVKEFGFSDFKTRLG